MLLPAIVKTILFYGGLVIAGLGVLVFTVLRDEERKKEEQEYVPPATIVGAKDPSRIWKFLPAAMLLIGVGLVLLMWLETTDVIIVTDDGPSVNATRKIRLFGASHYVESDARPYSSTDNPTWVVNESSHAVRVKEVTYGRSLGFGGSDTTTIAPNTASAFRRIDHVGPSDPPPDQVEDKIKFGMDWRYWLTWD